MQPTFSYQMLLAKSVKREGKKLSGERHIEMMAHLNDAKMLFSTQLTMTSNFYLYIWRICQTPSPIRLWKIATAEARRRLITINSA